MDNASDSNSNVSPGARVSRTVGDVIQAEEIHVERSLLGAAVARNDVTVSRTGTLATVAGHDARASQVGGQVVVAGHDVSVSQGGAGFILAGGGARVDGGFVGVVASPKVTLSGTSRVLLTFPMALAFGVALGATFGLIQALLRGGACRRR